MSKMSKIKSKWIAGLVIFSLTIVTPRPAKADIFGGDVAVLSQILANAVQQLVRLREIVGATRSNLDLLRDINRGINEALNLMKTIYPESSLGVYKDWENYQSAFRKAEEIYGAVVKSKDAAAQGHLDRSIVEAIVMYNKLAKNSRYIDQIGESIKSQSLRTSPKGAARLTAQGVGVSLHVQNQSLRTQGALLKIQAQKSAIENKKDKDATRFFLKSANHLSNSMKAHNPQFRTPRY